MLIKRKNQKILKAVVCFLLALGMLTAPSLAGNGIAQSPLGLIRKTPLYQNPVYDFDFPDPTVIRASNGYYYAYATQTVVAGVWQNIQIARSLDLSHWEYIGDALPIKPVWANQTQNFWAPHVTEAGGTYYMYYSADPNSQTGLCLAVATSSNPAGPFTDKGSPLL